MTLDLLKDSYRDRELENGINSSKCRSRREAGDSPQQRPSSLAHANASALAALSAADPPPGLYHYFQLRPHAGRTDRLSRLYQHGRHLEQHLGGISQFPAIFQFLSIFAP